LDSKLKVTTNPNGAAVNINSIYQGLSPVIVELPPLKPHVVEVSKPGYQTQTEEIILPTSEEIQANGTKDFLQIETSLKPIKGFIRVIGTEGASILADGKQIAQIPSTIELLAKAQTLIFQKEGYVTQELNIQPTPGYEQNLNIRLLTPQEAILAAMPEYIETSLGLQMRLISPGTFVMGTPRGDQGRRQGETERLIKITRPFYVGVREIINKEFRQFKPRHTSGAETFRELSNGLHPAVMLTWEEAVDFCQKLSSKESLEPAYEKINGQYQLIQPVTNGYRLLTEAEWEWVARFNGGAGKQRYPWGESMPVKPESGNYADESVEGLDLVANTLRDYWDGYPVTSPAQKFSPNALGIYDLGGNVAEWVNDYYSVYSTNLKQAELDPLGPDEGTARVIRGSSWRDSSISKLRFAYRNEYGTMGRLDVGFRIARYTDTSNIDE
jgi:formylglycine-generating enzyme required for sulfatase activity